jgi:arylsulfatase A-like enzyme
MECRNRIFRRSYFILLIFTFFLAPLPVLSTPPDSARMNVLFIAVDDLKPTLGCYGDAIARTPHMDAIAARGTVFSSNYCQQAVCAPSRASLLTGRYPDQIQIWDLQTQLREMNPGIVTLPEYLRKNGYQTAATGKIFDPRSVDEGRDFPSWSIPYLGPWNERFYNESTGKPAAYFYAGTEAKDTIALLEAEAAILGADVMEYIRERYFPAYEKADVPVDAYTDGAIANAGLELLNQVAAGNTPFFLAVGFNRPHLPFNAPSEFWDLYNSTDFTLAPFRQKATGSPDIGYHNYEELRSYTGIPPSGSVPDVDQLTLIHGYYAAVSYIDHLIGLLLNRLDELGLTGHTAIVLWGDHGWHLGDHDLWCKHSNFEQATRSPLIISYPGQPHTGSNTRSPTEFTDVAPTLCDLAGLPVPAYFEGHSLLPVMADTMASVRDGSLSQYPRGSRMGYSLRTGRYRYTRWTEGNGALFEDELYDYLLDPLETKDYSEDPGYQSVVGHLDSLLTLRILHPSTQHQLLFRITGLDKLGDTIPISNATVRFEDEILKTGGDGTTLVTHPKGAFQFQIEAPGYDPMTGLVRISGDSLIPIFLGAPEMRVSIRVLDFYTGDGIKDVRLLLNSVEHHTDYEGHSIYNEKQGTYILQLDHDHYGNRTDSIRIVGDTTMTFRLKPTHAAIKVILKEGGTPVGSATVALDTIDFQSNSWGIALFDHIPTQKTYTWSVEKNGYIDHSGTIQLLFDTAFTVQMERILDVEIPDEPADLMLWPNPAGDMIHLTIPAEGPFTLSLSSRGGEMVYRKTFQQRHVDLDLRPFGKGLYLISVESSHGLLYKKILKL